jgi:predicted ATPase
MEGEHELDIKPITILVGPNSAGKSAVLDALQWLQAMRVSSRFGIDRNEQVYKYKDYHRFGSESSWVGSEYIINAQTLGESEVPGRLHKYFFKTTTENGYKQTVNKRKPNEIHRIKQVYEFEQFSDKEATRRGEGDPWLIRELRAVNLKSVQIDLNGNTVLYVSAKKCVINLDHYPFLSRVQKKEIESEGVLEWSWEERKEGTGISLRYFLERRLWSVIPESIRATFFDILHQMNWLFSPYLELVPASRKILTPEESVFLPDSISGYEFGVGRYDLKVDVEKHIYKKHFIRDDRYYDPFLRLAQSLAYKKYRASGKKFLSQNTYYDCHICGFVDYTIKAEAYSFEEKDEYKVSFDGQINFCPVCGNDNLLQVPGENVDNIAFQNEDDDYAIELIDNLNRYLSEDFLIDTGYQIDGDASFIVNDDELYRSTIHGTKTVAPIIRLYLRDAKGNQLEFEDIGSGVAYSIPVLIAASDPSTRYFIQQPELHIHPALQARFGDIFADTLDGTKQYLIETHSEHLILRLLKLIRKKVYENFNADDLSILYFHPDPIKNSSSIKTIRVTEDGDFLDKWPDGFFEERYKDLFDE